MMVSQRTSRAPRNLAAHFARRHAPHTHPHAPTARLARRAISWRPRATPRAPALRPPARPARASTRAYSAPSCATQSHGTLARTSRTPSRSRTFARPAHASTRAHSAPRARRAISHGALARTSRTSRTPSRAGTPRTRIHTRPQRASRAPRNLMAPSRAAQSHSALTRTSRTPSRTGTPRTRIHTRPQRALARRATSR